MQYPYDFDRGGSTARSTDLRHAVEMLLQFLLTHPQDRVNRPEFGTPLVRMVHEGNAVGLSDLIQIIVESGLQRWLGDEIDVRALSVRAEDAVLVVDLTYRFQGDTDSRSETFHVPAPAGGAV